MKKEKKYSDAKKYFEKSMNLGNDEAIYELGKLHFQDIIESDDNNEKAIKYFKMSIDKGNFKAMFYYGRLLIKKEKSKEEGI